MSQDAPRATRPGQATLAGWLIIGGSIVLVATAWQRISTLRTLETQESLRSTLDQQPFKGTGLSVDTLSEVIRVLCMVGAASATAAAILGFYALRRSNSARVALSVLAPVILVGGFATGGFFAPMVVAGIVMLWLRPTRDWFAGRAWEPAATARTARRPDPFAPRDSAPEPDRQRAPEPAPGHDAARPDPEHQPPPPPQAVPPPGVAWGPRPAESPYGAARGAWPAPAAPVRRRPAALIWACTLVWVFCGIVAGGLLITALVLAAARDQLFTELERQQGPIEDLGVSESDVVLGAYVTTAVVVPWCVAAIVLAVLAFRGVGWARIALAVCSALAGLTALVFALFSPVLVVLVAAGATAAFMLLRRDVTAWFAQRRAER